MSLRHRFDLVIFDWAGTMVDFGSMAPVRALLETFLAEGVSLDERTVRVDMGKAKIDHIRALFALPEVASQWHNRHGRTPTQDDERAVMSRLEQLLVKYATGASTLIPGALETYQRLRAQGLRVASSTGYTRSIMAPIIASAAQQGYAPEHVVCSGETPAGRPSPLMIYKACADLGVWPLSRVVKVDDADVGIREGKNAGAFTVGVLSGNALGVSQETLQSLPRAEVDSLRAAARAALRRAGADLVIDSVGDLVPALEATIQQDAAHPMTARGR